MKYLYYTGKKEEPVIRGEFRLARVIDEFWIGDGSFNSKLRATCYRDTPENEEMLSKVTQLLKEIEEWEQAIQILLGAGTRLL